MKPEAQLNYLKIQPVPERKHFPITKSKWLMLFKEKIVVYSGSHTKPTNTKYRVFFLKLGWVYYPSLDAYLR
jgi:hypothetical protein